ncbi:MAG: hypothetical protein RLZZ450_430 [Pseudomonadota bacterium]|jgi:hypothetical protein
MVAALAASYAPSFSAPFLAYDDRWLIVDNPWLRGPGAQSVWHFFVDLSPATRIQLGAEYLPLRDTLVWLEARAFGVSPLPMHVVSVLMFAAAVLLLRDTLRRVWGPGLGTELASWLFALHPMHAESVCWLAGQKDLLALLFVTAALHAHARDTPHSRAWVPVLAVLACLAKSMAVVVLPLLWLQDVVLQRRPRAWVASATTLVVLSCLLVQVHVGRLVGMVGSPLGGSRYHALISMGPVWLRYLQQSLWPSGLSIVYDVPPLHAWDLRALLGYGVLSTWLVIGVLRARRGACLVLFSWAWFVVPLAPVAQVLVPLQNAMADRYLWLSLLGPALLLAHALANAQTSPRRGASRATTLVAGAMCVVLAGLTFERSVVFADEALLFTEATLRTHDSPRAPYQLGMALLAGDDMRGAEGAFREVLRRSPRGPVEVARRATNNLAKLLAASGRAVEAEALLIAGIARFPHDAKMRRNLHKLRGGSNEANAPAAGAANEPLLGE